MIDLFYSNTFMGAQGRDALDILEETVIAYRGRFTLVVEGAIPTKDNGIYNIIARSQKRSLTALDAAICGGSRLICLLSELAVFEVPQPQPKTSPNR